MPASGKALPGCRPSEVAALASSLDAEIEAESFGSHPSWMLDPPSMAAIALRARDAAREPGVRGVVVTHGTTTLEYTAFLADAVLDVATPIVLTGAMRRADDPHPDGPRNLRDAVSVATSDAARDRGALVVFHGRVIAGSSAWKARRVDEDAFLGTVGDVGQVHDGVVEIDRASDRYGPFMGELDTNVAFIKVVPGMGPEMLRLLPKQTAGLVVEALPGAGGIPPEMQHALVDIAARLLVVIAPRAPFGRIPPKPTGGTGEPLGRAPFLSCGPLTAEQAWLLLMLVLGEHPGPDSCAGPFRERTVARAATADDQDGG